MISFEQNLEENLFKIQTQLQNEIYEFGPYRSFYIHEPKKRLIESACFKDRVVHHALYEMMGPIFEPQFYAHSYACLRERGTHRAMRTLAEWITEDKDSYFLKCDIRKFFPSIDRNILMKIIERSIGDEKILRLFAKLIHSAPGEGGIPIGNLTSQTFANVYMNELDQFVKRKLRVPKYIRYMDDFVLLAENKAQAIQYRDTLEIFLRDELHLCLSPEKVNVGPVKEGLSFVGYCLRPHSVRVRGASLRRIQKKLRKAFHRSFGEGFTPDAEFWRRPGISQTPFYKTWAAYQGQIAPADWSLEVSQRMLRKLGFPE